MKKHKMLNSAVNRRDFIAKAGLAAGSIFLPSYLLAKPGTPQRFMSSMKVKGVNLGVITYSFRSMPSSAEDLLGYLSQLGLGTVELMGNPIEEYAGAPEGPGWKRGELSAEEKAEREAHTEEMRKWRTSVSMDKFKELRKKYNKEGVEVEIVKFGLDNMTDEEIDYCFKVADTMGAKGITLERSDEAVKKLAPFADKHKKMIGYHNHAKVDFNSWDAALQYAKYNALNLDVGHYVAGTNESPVPLIKKYHDRILNLHMKDRKKNNGDNVVWGQGDTPLREILQLMKQEKYPFMATIELEYPIPEGSDAVKEVGKCIEFCQDAIA
ncbi:sugar phosphate isomerase/epimerase family protein [Catalinimonas niigatensis]|uniref:sugar phosphate isomerase/epimerase family protein n=1 Tax=Catalinimonas niigatensis TaxID=1397264 RepID=UPI00266607C2|nr:sugar phosphate isomerase/epimerase [Catalinimonas niigatensis]WPP49469.1 sugar phosphate isomerase/epimerase [Catalinimonas niigatensis]